MKKNLLLFFILSFSTSFLSGQINIDTPNLSFDDGSLNGWKLYSGEYYFDNTTTSPTYGQFAYRWTPITIATAASTDRIVLVSNTSATKDPVINCDLLTNPYNKSVVRIGKPSKCESWNGSYYLKYSAAEKMEYTFKVTKNTTLLSYKLAVVLHVPQLENHLGDQRPSYSMGISVVDDLGVNYSLPCTSYNSKAGSGTGLLQNSNCTTSSAGSLRLEYIYQPWISGNIDLSAQIGKTVTITIITHDCLLTSGTNTDVAGNHSAYGYFRAETKKIELTTFSCENSDATITAPIGFTSYKWTRDDGKPVTVPDPLQPYIVTIEKSLNFDNVVYSCEMDDASSACGAIKVSTVINKVKLFPEFTSDIVDAGKIKFTSISTVENDLITNYYWDFGDGSYSNLQNPEHTYTEFIPFNVKLTVTSGKSCSKTISNSVLPTKELIASIAPPANLMYNGQTKDFTATTNIVGLQMNIDYYIKYTNRPGTPTYVSYIAPSTVGDYNATFELSYLSLIKYFIKTIPSEDFTITKAPLTVTVNNASKTYGDIIGLSKDGFTQSMSPLYAGDKIYELEPSCAGLGETAEVGTYPITTTKAIGIGVDNYDITFVPGTLTVNPKVLNIFAIDNAKTYGNQINPLGTEFYIAPGSLVNTDAVTTISLLSAGYDQSAIVGTYPIVASNAIGNRLSNYTISYKPAVMTVGKKSITVSANPQSKTYGTEFTFSGNEFNTDLTQLIAGDYISNVQFISLATPFKAIIGDYNITITGISGNRLDNYEIIFVNNTFKVKPLEVTIIANSKDKEYGDLLSFSGSEFTLDKPLISGDNILLVSFLSNGCVEIAPIGLYDIIPSSAYGTGTLNYDFTYQKGILTVVRKALSVILTPPSNLVYNSQNKDFTATLSVAGLVKNVDYFIRYTNKPGTPTYNETYAPNAAGDYTATFELSTFSKDRYDLTPIAKDFTITKAPLTVTSDDIMKTYGDILVLTKGAFKTNMKPLYGSDKISELDLTCAGVSETATIGTYPITITNAIGTGLENYEMLFVSGTLTVIPKSIVVRATDNTKVYGEILTSNANGFYLDSQYLVGTDNVVAVTTQSAGYAQNALIGSYPINISDATGPGLSNYKITYVGATLQVTKKSITVSATALPKLYGTEYVFTGTEYTTDASQLVGANIISSVQLSSQGSLKESPVGNYTISITGITGVGLENYDIKLQDNVLKVTPVAITITPNDLTKSFGEILILTGSEFSLDKPLSNSDAISYVILKSDGTSQNAAVADYDINALQAYGVGTTNYEFTYQIGKLSVVRKALSAILTPPSYLVYNSQNKEFTATLSVAGLVQNIDYSIRYTNKPGTSTYNEIYAPKAAGDYTATFELSASSISKYNLITTPTKDFTITKAPLTVTSDDIMKTYGDILVLTKGAFKTNMKPLYGSDIISELDLICTGVSETASIGTYPITITNAIGTGLENYEIQFVPGTLTVNSKSLVVRATDNTKTFGEVLTSNATGFYFDSQYLVGSDNVLAVITQSAGYPQNALIGSYPINISDASGPGLSNYKITYVGATLQVTKKSITVSATALPKLYGTEYVFTGTEYTTDASQLVGANIISSVQLSSQGSLKQSPVGDYTISITGITGVGLENYDIKLQDNVLKVTPVAITITPNDLPKSFGELLILTGTEYSLDKPLSNSDAISYVILKSDGTAQNAAVADYAINALQAYGVGTTNYEFTYQVGKLSVVRKTLSAILTPPSYLIYNSQTKDFTVTLSVAGLVQNVDYSIRYTNRPGTPSYNEIIAPSVAGDYTATFELSASSISKYELITTPTKDFTITKAPLTVTSDDIMKTYGDILVLTKGAFKTNMKPLYGSDIISELDLICAGVSETASIGTYPITITNAIGTGLENYEIQFVPGALTVNPKSLVVRATDNTKTFGEVLTSNATGFYLDSKYLVGSDNVLAVITQSAGYPQNALIGSYPINISDASGPGLSNYTISYVDATLLVTKKSITISATAQTKLYGTEYVFTGTEYTTDASQLVGANIISSVQLSSQGSFKQSPVGDYTISITAITGVGLENYDIKLQDNVLKVTPVEITITPKDLTKPFGEILILTGTEFSLDKPLSNSDAISYVMLKSDGTAQNAAVADYDINILQAYGVGTTNYIFTYKVGKLSVIQTPFLATITPPSNLVYNAQNKEFTATLNVVGLKQNVDYYIRYTNKPGTPYYDSYTAPSAAGDYTATFELSSLSMLKYSMVAIPGVVFTISKSPLKITAENLSKVYGEKLIIQNNAYKMDMNPLYGNDVISEVVLECNGIDDTATAQKYPISPIKVVGVGVENYDISFVVGTLTVNKKPLIIRALNEFKTYGELVSSNSTNYYVDKLDLVANDMLTSVTLFSEGYASTAAVGSYSVKITNANGDRMPNYQITYLDGNIQVLKKAISISAKPISKEYGSEYLFKGNEFEFNATQLVGSDNISSVLVNSLGAQSTASVGEYILSITDVLGSGMLNYEIATRSGVLMVTPKSVIVKGKDIEKEYGDVFTFSGSEFSTNILLSNNDVISFAFLKSNGAEESAPIGVYDIIPTMATGAGSLNYNISYQPGKLNVVQKQLFVNVQNYVKEYGQADPILKFTVVDKRGVAFQSTMLSGDLTRVAGEKPGEYAITQGTLSISANYNFIFTEGKLVIKKALPTIDPYFTNISGQFIIADVYGSNYGDYPQGNLIYNIDQASISNFNTLNKGAIKTPVSNLPNHMVKVDFNYPGDDNYLPATKTLNVYAIIYHTDGGELTAPITNFDGNETVKLETPTRNNSKFEGWYDNEDFSGISIRQISIGTYRDVHLYAKWLVTYEDLSIVVLFNQVLAVANPLNREFLSKSTYKWYKDEVLLSSSKQYCGFDNYVPTAKYKVEIYYLNNSPIVLELNHVASIPKSKMYPNPLTKNTQLTLNTELAKEEDVSVEIYTLKGVQLNSIKIVQESDKFVFSGFDFPGVYIIRILQKGIIKENHKVIVGE